MQCARADNIYGPYETVVVSGKETFGTLRTHSVENLGIGSPVPAFGYDFKIGGGEGNYHAAVPMHQGGIVDLPNGDWWGWSMCDWRGVGRTTCLSPVTWADGWPYFGLPKNLGRSPRTWTKPNVNADSNPTYPYKRNDDFDGKTLQPIWQWNHDPEEKMWKLSGGKLQLKTMPANDFLWARNTLTQRCMGPVSTATVEIELSKLKAGDVAGFALLNMPYAWIGVKKHADGSFTLKTRAQYEKQDIEQPLSSAKKIYLRIHADLEGDKATLSYSTDGKQFSETAKDLLLGYQLKTFQGSRYSLFAYNESGKNGGTASFDNFVVEEPMADRSANLPIGKVISLKNLSNGSYAWANPHGMLHIAWEGSEQYNKKGCFFKVHDRGKGVVALEAMNGTGFLTVVGAGLSCDVRLMPTESEGSLFMWQDMLYGNCMLLSMKTQRYVGIDPATGEPYGADWQGCRPERKDGTVFEWNVVESDGVVKQTEKSNTY